MFLLRIFLTVVFIFISDNTIVDQKANSEVICLAQNIYHEARNQSEKGRMAVGLVTLNRVKHSAFPNSTCEVVYQGKHKRTKHGLKPIKNQCQFSWYCNDKPNDIHNIKVYKEILELSYKLLNENIVDFTKNALYYHNTTVNPYWAEKKRKTIKIEDHIFYR